MHFANIKNIGYVISFLFIILLSVDIFIIEFRDYSLIRKDRQDVFVRTKTHLAYMILEAFKKKNDRE